MTQVLVSSKYQVVIPKEVRREFNIKSGQKMNCIAINGIIHLVPDKPLSAMRGFIKRVSLENLREKKDRDL